MIRVDKYRSSEIYYILPQFFSIRVNSFFDALSLRVALARGDLTSHVDAAAVALVFLSHQFVCDPVELFIDLTNLQGQSRPDWQLLAPLFAAGFWLRMDHLEPFDVIEHVLDVDFAGCVQKLKGFLVEVCLLFLLQGFY